MSLYLARNSSVEAIHFEGFNAVVPLLIKARRDLFFEVIRIRREIAAGPWKKN
jgi:hypothetical protein